MSAASYRVRTTHSWLMSRSKQWLADEVFFLMNSLEIPHAMRTSEPLKTLYSKDQLARQYSAFASQLPDP